MPTNTKCSIENLKQKEPDRFNSSFVWKAIEYDELLSQDTLSFVESYAVANGSCLGYAFMAILTSINFLAAAMGIKIATTENWLVNFNTYGIVGGPRTSGKTLTVRTFIEEPFKG